MKKESKIIYFLLLSSLMLLMLNPRVNVALEEGFQSSPTSGGSNSSKTESESNFLYNVTFLISNWLGDQYLRGLNVSVYDLHGNIILSGFSNDTGHFSARLEGKSYGVIIRSSDRIVGCQEIYVNMSGTIFIRTWAYPLNVTCIDQEGSGILGAVVILYSQSDIANATIGSYQLVGLAKTNKKGVVTFNNIWNGTYKIVVESGKIIGEKTINIDGPKHVTIKCNRTFLELRILTSASMMNPLSNATVLLQDSAGYMALRGLTDQNGCIKFSNVYPDNYTIFVDWLGMQVFSGTLNVGVDKIVEIKVPVFEVALKIIDPLGNPLSNSKVLLKRAFLRRVGSNYFMETLKLFELESNKNGFILCLLPSGTYEVSCFSGIYSGKITVSLTDNYSGVLQCSVQFNMWILLLLVSLPLSILSILMERRRLKRPLEYRRYQNMLLNLETMYNNGLVEYKIYRKLREEYETKLMELGGRRRR